MFESNKTTFMKIALLAALIIFPLLFRSTGAQRHLLELDKLQRLIDSGFPVTIPVSIRFGDNGFYFPDLAKATQVQVDAEMQRTFPKNLKVKVVDDLKLKETQNGAINPDDYEVNLMLHGENSVSIHSHKPKAYLSYTMSSVHSNDLPFYITQAILKHLLAPEVSFWENTANKFVTVAKVNLIFVEPAPSDISPIALIQNVENFLHDCEGIHNISVDSRKVAISDLNSLEQDKNTLDFYFYDKKEIKDIKERADTLYFDYDQDEFNNAENVIISKLEEELGIPKNPANNLKLRISPMIRAVIIENIAQSIKEIKKLVHIENFDLLRSELFTLIDDMEGNAKSDWSDFLARSRELLQHCSVDNVN
ncbi:uncharacterized protein RJT20DRAFT_63937 [Scheffersomyces xylosifermentans]|uniref:uncharacterized protein n=1 Tax=Scheffersomyces xylosifermentans TaxID=1304137 RepID=UPI00315D1457